jgi:hypothetical protein
MAHCVMRTHPVTRRLSRRAVPHPPTHALQRAHSQTRNRGNATAFKRERSMLTRAEAYAVLGRSRQRAVDAFVSGRWCVRSVRSRFEPSAHHGAEMLRRHGAEFLRRHA